MIINYKNLFAASVLSIGLFSCSNNEVISSKTDTTKVSDNKTDTPVVVQRDSIPEKFVWKAPVYDSTKQYIYLTFDDGPQPGTLKCLEICKKLGVKATFFMVGEHAEDKWGMQIVNTIKESYPDYLLTNHSYAHAFNRYNYFYKHREIAINDFEKAQQFLGVPYKIIRLPGNSAWVRENEHVSSPLTRAVTKKLDSLGYNVLGWDQEWNFRPSDAQPIQTPGKIAGEIVWAVKNNRVHTKNHVVILTHDRMFRTPANADSLFKMIQLLKQHKNFVFETMDNYPGLKTPKAEPITVSGTAMK